MPRTRTVFDYREPNYRRLWTRWLLATGLGMASLLAGLQVTTHAFTIGSPPEVEVESIVLPEPSLDSVPLDVAQLQQFPPI